MKKIFFFLIISASISIFSCTNAKADTTLCKEHLKNCPISEDCPEHPDCEAHEKCAKEKDCKDHPNCEAFEKR